jgi:hypothetical protein
MRDIHAAVPLLIDALRDPGLSRGLTLTEIDAEPILESGRTKVGLDDGPGAREAG